jgi:hypothetical protein
MTTRDEVPIIPGDKPELPQSKPVSPVVEYYIQTIPLPIENDDVVLHLNKLGEDRWRLILVTITNDARLWFIREVDSNGQ